MAGLACGLVQPPAPLHWHQVFTHHQRHGGQAVGICRHSAVVYEQDSHRHPRRWSRSVLHWHHPEVVCINTLSTEMEHRPVTLVVAARRPAVVSAFLTATVRARRAQLCLFVHSGGLTHHVQARCARAGGPYQRLPVATYMRSDSGSEFINYSIGDLYDASSASSTAFTLP